jgi:hypothetical protein
MKGERDVLEEEKTMTRIVSLLLCVVLAACATSGAENVERLAAGAKIVPLSLMGDTFSIQYIGTMVFQNERRDLPEPHWQVDKRTEALAARLVSRGGRFTSEAVDATSARQAANKLEDDLWNGKAATEGRAGELLAFATSVRADYLLVIRPAPLGDPFFNTNQAFVGYGIGERTFFGSKRGINFLTLQVALLHAKDGKEVAQTFGFVNSRRSDDDWLEPGSLSPSEANLTSTQAAIESLFDTLMATRLRELKLTP